MANNMITSGTLLDIDGVAWRIIYTSSTIVRIINTETEKIEIRTLECSQVREMLEESQISIKDDNEIYVIDPSMLSESLKTKYDRNKSMVMEFARTFGPTYKDLEGKCADLATFVEDNKDRLGIPKTTFYRLIRKWLQSGMQDSSLIYTRRNNTRVQDPCNADWPSSYVERYAQKPGRKGPNGKLLNKKDFENFETMRKEYMHNPKLTKTSLYNMMLLYYYMGDDTEKPTQKQLNTYLDNNISELNQKIRKKSAREIRNNERLLKDTPRRKDMRPGDILEVDAWESDIEIISEYKEAQVVGKPIVYFMLDVCTKAIVSYYVGFENNSQIGLASIFLNLIAPVGEDKENGKFANPGILPKILRCDRGAEYKSHYIERISKELRFETQLVPAAMGSYKGTVEHSFSVLHNSFRAFLRKAGVIEPIYESNHRKEACLTMTQYREYIDLYVKTYNMRERTRDKLPIEMMKEGYGKSPLDIWNYKMSHGGGPRVIPDSFRNQAIYYLMYEGTATISREGIIFHNLVYQVENDIELETRMLQSKNNANKRDTSGVKINSLEIRYDPMNIDKLYYLRDGKVKELSIHPRKNADIHGITWSQYFDYLKILGDISKEGEEKNRKLDTMRIVLLDKIKTEATDGIRFIPRYEEVSENRFRDKELDNYRHNMSTHMLDDSLIGIENKNEEVYPDYSNSAEDIPENTEASNVTPPAIEKKEEPKTKNRPVTMEDLINLYKKDK